MCVIPGAPEAGSSSHLKKSITRLMSVSSSTCMNALISELLRTSLGVWGGVGVVWGEGVLYG